MYYGQTSANSARYDTEVRYKPDFWDELTGFDFGTDRCYRNGFEAYVCYSNILTNAVLRFGWDQSATKYLIDQAFPYRTSTSEYFWTQVQANFMNWVKDTGFFISDFPKWKKVLRVMDSATEGAFSYQKAKEDADNIFQNTLAKTGSDLWEMWQTQVPFQLRVLAYVIAGGAILSYTYPIFGLVGRSIKNIKKLVEEE